MSQLPPRPKSAVLRQGVTIALMLGAIAYGLIAVGCPK